MRSCARSREVTREFQREHPCPSTGRTSGACPGYRKDHVEPLACGGPDAVSNLKWAPVATAYRCHRRTSGFIKASDATTTSQLPALSYLRVHDTVPSVGFRSATV